MRIYRAGSRNRVPAGRVPANLQAPAIGCLQACRHPAGTQKVPSRHPGSDAGCLQAPCRHPAGTQQAPGVGCRVLAGPGRHPAGTRDRLPGACRRPAGTQQAPGIASRVPAGTSRHPAGTRDRVPGACRHQQAPSRHPESGAGCLQAPCRHPAGTRGRVPGACGHPAGTQQASGIGSRSSKLYEKRKRSCPPLMLPSPTVCASRRRRTAMSKEGESAPEVSTRARVRQASTKLTSRGDCRAAPFNADS